MLLVGALVAAPRVMRGTESNATKELVEMKRNSMPALMAWRPFSQ